MVRQQVVSDDLNGVSLATFTHQSEKRTVVNRFREDDTPIVTTINDVQRASRNDDATGSRHQLFLLRDEEEATSMPDHDLRKPKK